MGGDLLTSKLYKVRYTTREVEWVDVKNLGVL